jgi:hypothetical protein
MLPNIVTRCYFIKNLQHANQVRRLLADFYGEYQNPNAAMAAGPDWYLVYCMTNDSYVIEARVLPRIEFVMTLTADIHCIYNGSFKSWLDMVAWREFGKV